MDGHQKSPHAKRHKIYVRGKEGGALKKLYKESEIAADEFDNDGLAPATEAEIEELQGDEVAKYLHSSKEQDESDVPEKHDKKTRRKKAAAKRKAATKRGLKIAIPLAILLIAFGVFAFLVLRPHFNQAEVDRTETEAATIDAVYYSPLTGMEVASAEVANGRVSCVMIENSDPDARPQSGLKDAGIVYEVVAEGGITRFMAVFQESKPSFVGPIRSLRLTYAHLAKQYQCTLFHYGGARNAIELVENSANGYRDGKLIYDTHSWRENRSIGGHYRYAPHNVYSSFTKLDDYSYSKGWNSSKFEGFKRVSADAILPDPGTDATTINITMTNWGNYSPTYKYDAVTNTYKRFYGNQAHSNVDNRGVITQLAPAVVIAMKVNAVSRPGTNYYDYTTTGSNTAFVFQNGTAIVGTWKRNSVNDPLKFYDGEGNEIALNRGQVWISAYPNQGGAVNYK